MAREPEFIMIGGGGHALVVAQAALQGGVERIAVYDDNPNCVAVTRFRLRPAGSFAKLFEKLPELPEKQLPGPVIIAVGDLALRRSLIDRLGPQDFTTVSALAEDDVDPGAIELGVGVYLGVRCVLQPFCTIGDHAIINTAAIIEHECVIGENAHIAPGAVLGGNVTIGRDTLVGLGSRVLPGIKVGSGCVIGAGAVVTKDVADGATVIGCPARVR